MEIPESYKWRSKCSGEGGQRLLSRRIFMASAFTSLVRAQKAEVSSFELKKYTRRKILKYL